jgi:hypothetical protein
VTFARLEPYRFGRVLHFQAREVAATGVVSSLRALADFSDGRIESRDCARPEQERLSC